MNHLVTGQYSSGSISLVDARSRDIFWRRTRSDENAIPVRIKSVTLFDRVTVCRQHVLGSGEGADQHQQRGLGQMEICKQGADYSELESRIDEQVGFAATGQNASGA